MNFKSVEVELAIVGAGAAGLGAAMAARRLGLRYIVLEASHRIGGRAYTEQLAPGVPFDLGCHWMHSASVNPFTAVAERLGFGYRTDRPEWRFHLDGAWAGADTARDYAGFAHRAKQRIAAADPHGAIVDVLDRDSRWTPLYDHWLSLMTSADPDQVAIRDLVDYHDTGEDWPVRQGYGSLIACFAARIPVQLNSAVQSIDWSGGSVRLTTGRGTVSARAALITVSTGILGAGDIVFRPALPSSKQAAIAAFPLGNHNRICLAFDRQVIDDEVPSGVFWMNGDRVPMLFEVRPFGDDYIAGGTGGRFADWLERAGPEAAADYAGAALRDMFGNAITRHVVRHNVTAWGGDPWIKGAYSISTPGTTVTRAELASSIDGRLFFAGEATAEDAFCTAHGAFLSGVRTTVAATVELGANPGVAPDPLAWALARGEGDGVSTDPDARDNRRYNAV